MRDLSLRFGGIGLVWIGWAALMFVLWVAAFWGFHHDYALGLFAWLMIGGEEGFSVMPNPCGIALNGLLTAFATWCAGAASRRLVSNACGSGRVMEVECHGT